MLSVGKEAVERVYVLDTDQGREAAEKTLKRSQRKRLIGYQHARPTSYYRAEAERLGLPFPMPVASTSTRRRRRA